MVNILISMFKFIVVFTSLVIAHVLFSSGSRRPSKTHHFLHSSFPLRRE